MDSGDGNWYHTMVADGLNIDMTPGDYWVSLTPANYIVGPAGPNYHLGATDFWGDATATIEGHCDERGTNEYNLDLGDRRAESAKAFLTDLGIDPARLTTISYGEERPVDPRHMEEAWAKNRRDHFVVN